jgi:lipid A 3-O-deacylase
MEKGTREIQVWAGGGHSVPGGTSRVGLSNIGVRFGWVLTRPFGPGPLRGSIEYAADIVPFNWVNQPGQGGYGFGLNPFAFKWNFHTGRSWQPYLELGGGVLFTNREVPTGTSRINFTSGTSAGIMFLRGQIGWTAEVRYMHISNAGLATSNPGINTVQVRLGLSWLKHRRAKSAASGAAKTQP